MRSNRLVIFSLSIFIISCFPGCTKTDANVTQSNKIINGTKTNTEKQTNERDEEYKLKPNISYYVLNDEYLEENDAKNPNSTKLIRQFMCYNGIKNEIYPYTTSDALDNVSNIEEFRKKLLLDNPDGLKLPPSTIVSLNVLSKWQSQNYDGSGSYFDKSPKGLTYNN